MEVRFYRNYLGFKEAGSTGIQSKFWDSRRLSCSNMLSISNSARSLREKHLRGTGMKLGEWGGFKIVPTVTKYNAYKTFYKKGTSSHHDFTPHIPDCRTEDAPVVGPPPSHRPQDTHLTHIPNNSATVIVKFIKNNKSKITSAVYWRHNIRN